MSREKPTTKGKPTTTGMPPESKLHRSDLRPSGSDTLSSDVGSSMGSLNLTLSPEEEKRDAKEVEVEREIRKFNGYSNDLETALKQYAKKFQDPNDRTLALQSRLEIHIQTQLEKIVRLTRGEEATFPLDDEQMQIRYKFLTAMAKAAEINVSENGIPQTIKSSTIAWNTEMNPNQDTERLAELDKKLPSLQANISIAMQNDPSEVAMTEIKKPLKPFLSNIEQTQNRLPLIPLREAIKTLQATELALFQEHFPEAKISEQQQGQNR
jgi:hypothetical protein